eukprot:gnl/TRDRNA2_/TRDRNA2_81968_c0_seq1.p1 gnl/TRDRNA2_/TRDRNA2_81968_c0~~gnl/TRDRNA2_/TRDRNA2_81968_c0_seq1.p1  ORF type:complete len:328 (-),score=65.51 gnl/TRDRNA2_/TRDRNA2_81968_c0_seq1:35-1018(-)
MAPPAEGGDVGEDAGSPEKQTMEKTSFSSSQRTPASSTGHRSSTRGFPASGLDLERNLAALKVGLREHSAKKQKLEQRMSRRQRRMADDYQKRIEEKKVEAVRERERRMARLSLEQAHAAKKKAASALPPMGGINPAVDEEMADLFQQYGAQIRVPASCQVPEFSRKSRRKSFKQIVPIAKTAGSAQQAGKPRSNARQEVKQMIGATGGKKSLTDSAGFTLAHAIAAASNESVPEPQRSLMPRKEGLRQVQSMLLRKDSGIVFYKSHMRKHFEKILGVTELKFTDVSGRRAADGIPELNYNLARPLTASEIKQLKNHDIAMSRRIAS